MLKPILLVEDDPRDLELMLMAIESTATIYKVDVVRDGIECLDYLHARGGHVGRKTGNPVVVILDHTLPKMDGLEVLSAIRQSEELRGIPVVMLTSSIRESAVDRAYKLGANACVVKPVGFQDFRRVIADILKFWTRLNTLPGSSE